MTDVKTSPPISKLQWGQVRISGENRIFKDVKIFPGGAQEWDWRETGTRHSPGVQPADVVKLLEHGAKIVILSTGINERLEVMPETLSYLEEHGVETHVLQTKDAAAMYNKLAQTERVGALIHSTC